MHTHIHSTSFNAQGSVRLSGNVQHLNIRDCRATIAGHSNESFTKAPWSQRYANIHSVNTTNAWFDCLFLRAPLTPPWRKCGVRQANVKSRPSSRRLEACSTQTYRAYTKAMHALIVCGFVIHWIRHNENAAYDKRTWNHVLHQGALKPSAYQRTQRTQSECIHLLFVVLCSSLPAIKTNAAYTKRAWQSHPSPRRLEACQVPTYIAYTERMHEFMVCGFALLSIRHDGKCGVRQAYVNIPCFTKASWSLQYANIHSVRKANAYLYSSLRCAQIDSAWRKYGVRQAYVKFSCSRMVCRPIKRCYLMNWQVESV